MRQGDGSDLLGQGDPRSADIGILYVGPEDSRQEILTAINAQELQGRKQIAIVLPEQGKAFRQPVEFDGLKNMRRGLKAHLIFIAPSGPGPAEFARQRRFLVYSSPETFKAALLDDRVPSNPRAKAADDEKRPGLLGRGRGNKGRNQNPPAVPPTPRVQPAASAQPPPTPRIQPQASGPASQAMPPVVPIGPISPIPIDEMDTYVPEPEKPVAGRGSGTIMPPSGAGMGALTANALDDDEGLAPPVTPRQPQSGAPPSGPMRSEPPTRTLNPAREPAPLLLGQQTNTPRPGGSGKLPAASAQGSQTRTGTGKQPTTSGRGGSRPGSGQGRGTRQLSTSAAQGAPDASDPPRQPNGKSGDTGKISAVVPVGIVAGGAAAASVGSAASASANAPAMAGMAATGTPGGPGVGQRQVVGLTPLPPPVSRRRRSRGRKRLLLVILLIFTLLLVGWLVVDALGGPSGLVTLGRLTATVTITPRSQTVQNNYLIAGVTTTPDAGQRQVAARVLTAQSDTKQATHDATGSIPATRATGQLIFFNSTGGGLTIAGNGQTVLTGGDGVQVTFNEPVFVPATGSASATINDAYALQTGSSGNIPAFDITGQCCVSGGKISVKNTVAFHGGQDAQVNSIIQQSDIDGAANPLVSQLKTSTLATLQKQMKSNERVVDGSQQCPATTTANHKAGEVAKTVAVSVSVKCTEEVFDFAAAQQMAGNFLQSSPPTNVDLLGYKLVGPIITSLVSTTVVSGENQVSVNMQAAGKWVYQFSNQVQQNIKQTLVNKPKAEAQAALKQYVGLASASISISSGSTMPANASDITLTIVPVSGLQPGIPGGTSGGPTNTPTVASTPVPTATGSPEQGS